MTMTADDGDRHGATTGDRVDDNDYDPRGTFFGINEYERTHYRKNYLGKGQQRA